ncbi:MAG: hypothetical protein ACI867_000542, partial [Glaciecola sp.]
MTWRRRTLYGAAVFLAFALIVPLLWWQVLGPNRLTGLELGVDPATSLQAQDFGDLSGDAVVVTPSPSATDDEIASARAPEPVIELPPLNLSPTTTVTVIFSVGSNGMTQTEASRLRVG